VPGAEVIVIPGSSQLVMRREAVAINQTTRKRTVYRRNARMACMMIYIPDKNVLALYDRVSRRYYDLCRISPEAK
jgi:hypothetical protein